MHQCFMNECASWRTFTWHGDNYHYLATKNRMSVALIYGCLSGMERPNSWLIHAPLHSADLCAIIIGIYMHSIIPSRPLSSWTNSIVHSFSYGRRLHAFKSKLL
jgi:hypothetical protein